MVLIGVLFALGVVSTVVALWRGAYIWSKASAAASLFLKWPIERVDHIRKLNLALAAAPAFNL